MHGIAFAPFLSAMARSSSKRCAIRLHDDRGFTLIELLTVVTIIAIGTVLAAPHYLRWNSQYQLRQAVTEVHSQLMLARMAAMNRSAATRVTLAISGGRVVIRVTDDTSGAVVLTPTTFMAGVSNVVGGPIVFSPLGLRISGTVGTAQNMTLTNTSGLQYGVKVTAGGKATWCTSATCT